MGTRTLRMTRRPRAFTLIELLVVVAIIALLISILLPSINRARQQTKTVVCASNVREIGKGMLYYMEDNNGFVQRDYDWNEASDHELWAVKYSRYIGEVIPQNLQDWCKLIDDDSMLIEELWKSPIYQCPAQRRTEHALHYVVNGLSFSEYKRVKEYRQGGPLRVSQLPREPFYVAYLVDFNPQAIPVDQLDLSDMWTAFHWPFDPWDQPSPQPRAIHADDDRHLGRCNVLFFDAHVETLRLKPEEMPLTMYNPLSDP